eukprot:2530814-Rhodomonas_salina.2
MDFPRDHGAPRTTLWSQLLYLILDPLQTGSFEKRFKKPLRHCFYVLPVGKRIWTRVLGWKYGL